jgi:hypothetical protein
MHLLRTGHIHNLCFVNVLIVTGLQYVIVIPVYLAVLFIYTVRCKQDSRDVLTKIDLVFQLFHEKNGENQ